MQCTEGTQRNCTVLAVIHESIIPARLFLSLPQISTPDAAQELQSPSHSAHQTSRGTGEGWAGLWHWSHLLWQTVANTAGLHMDNSSHSSGWEQPRSKRCRGVKSSPKHSPRGSDWIQWVPPVRVPKASVGTPCSPAFGA